MKYKYGEYPDTQVHDYKKRLHALVHWLLIYKEENNDVLEQYFEKVQDKLNGFNELIGYPVIMVDIMNLVETARLESIKEDFDHKKYRSLILDTHSLIDKLPENDQIEK